MSKILTAKKLSHRILGRIRLFFGECPRCNSDAPNVYSCHVCEFVHIKEQSIPVKNNRDYPTVQTKALWWYNWVQKFSDGVQYYHEKTLEHSGLKDHSIDWMEKEKMRRTSRG
jgi:hypothetical protein